MWIPAGNPGRSAHQLPRLLMFPALTNCRVCSCSQPSQIARFPMFPALSDHQLLRLLMFPALTSCRVCLCSQRSPVAAFAHILSPDFQLKEKNLEVEGMLGSALIHVFNPLEVSRIAPDPQIFLTYPDPRIHKYELRIRILVATLWRPLENIPVGTLATMTAFMCIYIFKYEEKKI
jgi:hypothetical protein